MISSFPRFCADRQRQTDRQTPPKAIPARSMRACKNDKKRKLQATMQHIYSKQRKCDVTLNFHVLCHHHVGLLRCSKILEDTRVLGDSCPKEVRLASDVTAQILQHVTFPAASKNLLDKKLKSNPIGRCKFITNICCSWNEATDRKAEPGHHCLRT